MKIYTGEFRKICSEIERTNKRITIYGAGMIGSVTTLSILNENNLLGRVAFFADGDSKKWGTEVEGIRVEPKSRLKEINGSDFILIIAISRFYDLYLELEEYENLKGTECCIIPMLCIDNYPVHEESIISKNGDKPIIPKVINYMWLGHNPLPAPLQKCIDSWKRFCPDYEIRCFNEDNYDIEKVPYMKQAYEAKAFGFVPDYARLDILYNYGGIYLDTDVELVKPLDDLLYQEAFCCVEKWQTVNFGGGSGAAPGNKLIGDLLKERERISFIEEDGSQNRNTCGYYDTKFFMERGYRINGKLQTIEGVSVYPYEVFHPYDYMSGKTSATENTYGIHHFNGGWLDEKQAEANRLSVKNYERVCELANRIKSLGY